MEKTPAVLITCDMCGKTTSDNEEDTLLFGEWMKHMQLKVHYFCLLLSTNLPQRGSETGGILGFLVRDIRKEVVAAQKRICGYCGEPGATIECHKCGKYFDLICSIENPCTTQFSGEFHSYCSDCPPMDEYRQQLVDHPPKGVTCDICLQPILLFGLHKVVYPECCRLGFVHKMCMRRYAMSSGYYLACIWCRSAKFRDTVRLQGIFVPDRDSEWERQKNAYRELHTRTLRCDEDECLSAKGRSYNKKAWHINACQICGSAGAHARCLAGSMHLRKGAERIEFKCTGCQEVETKLANSVQRLANLSLKPNDTLFFVTKVGPAEQPESSEGPVFSDDEGESTSNASVITVIPNAAHRQTGSMSCTSPNSPVVASPPQSEAIDLLTDSQPGQDGNAKPLVLRESFNCVGESFFYMVIYEFDETDTCKGSCTLRFAEDDPRIQDKSEEALKRVQIRPGDVWFRNKDCGVFGIVHKYQDKR